MNLVESLLHKLDYRNQCAEMLLLCFQGLPTFFGLWMRSFILPQKLAYNIHIVQKPVSELIFRLRLMSDIEDSDGNYIWKKPSPFLQNFIFSKYISFVILQCFLIKLFNFCNVICKFHKWELPKSPSKLRFLVCSLFILYFNAACILYSD